jgi:hypothetical protein
VVEAFLKREQKFIRIQKELGDRGKLTHLEQVMQQVARLQEAQRNRESEARRAAE